MIEEGYQGMAVLAKVYPSLEFEVLLFTFTYENASTQYFQ